MPQHDARARSRASGSAPPGVGSFRERFVALRTLRPFMVMVWKTSPSLTFFSLLLRLARALLPVATLYVGKLIIDDVVRLAQMPEHPTTLPDWLASGRFDRMTVLITIEFGLAILADMIGKVIFAITSDESRYQINGTLMIANKKQMTLVATDGHRLAYVSGRLEKGSTDDKIEIIIPRKAVQELSRLGEGEEEVLFGQKDNHVFFKLGKITLLSTIVPGKFPDYEKVIPEGNDKILKLESGSLGDVVRRVALLSSERSRAVKFSLGKGTVEISSNNPEVGEASETLDVEYNGPEIEVGFNAKYLIDFLQAMGPGPVILAIKDEATQGLLRPVGLEGRDYRYVVMPMRL